MVGPVDGAGVGWASEPGLFLSYVSAGRRRRILEGLDTVNLPGHSGCSKSTTFKCIFVRSFNVGESADVMSCLFAAYF